MKEFSIEELERLGLSQAEAQDIFNKDKDIYSEKPHKECGHTQEEHNNMRVINLNKHKIILTKCVKNIIAALEKISQAEERHLKPVDSSTILAAIIDHVINNIGFKDAETMDNQDDKISSEIRKYIVDNMYEMLKRFHTVRENIDPLEMLKDVIRGIFQE